MAGHKVNGGNRERERLTQQILKLSDDIFRALRLSIPQEWMSADLTLAQIRVLLVLFRDGQQRMGTLAKSIGVTVSTATGVVDNLVRKGLVLRESDPEDRRLVICHLSPTGEEQVKRLWALGRFQIKRLLRGLSLEELQKTADVGGMLLANVTPPGDVRGNQPIRSER
jgi:DNA-binding MarR family transcriptional regulator